MFLFEEAGFTVHTVDQADSAKFDRYHRFRKQVFADELQWVKCESDREIDQYDAYSTHLVVEDAQENVVACVRLLPYTERGFMIDDCFLNLVDPALDPAYPRAQSLEISRLAIHPDHRISRTLTGKTLAHMLYRALYQWTVSHGFRYWYVVVFPFYLKILKAHHFPFRSITSAPIRSRPTAISAAVDVRVLEKNVWDKDPDMMSWYAGGMNLPDCIQTSG